MMNEDWKAALGAAFNYNPDEATHEATEEPTDASADALAEQGKQMLNVMLDKRNRNGKRVTLVTDFVGSDEALKCSRFSKQKASRLESSDNTLKNYAQHHKSLGRFGKDVHTCP